MRVVGGLRGFLKQKEARSDQIDMFHLVQTGIHIEWRLLSVANPLFLKAPAGDLSRIYW